MGRLQNDAYPWLLASLLLVALALRVYGIAWDQGYLFHPDERAILMKVGDLSFPPVSNLKVLLDPEKSPLNPKWFPYGSLPLYLLRIASDILSKFMGPLSIGNMAILGRTFSAILDTISILAVYLLGARLYSRKVGFLAAAFTAFTVLHIQLSHFYTVETMVTPFILLTLLFLWKLVERGSLRAATLAGVFWGLAMATKVSSAPLALSVVMAGLLFLLRLPDGTFSLSGISLPRVLKAFGLVAIAGACAVVTFAIAEPYAFLDWHRFLADVQEQSEMVRRVRDYPYTRQYVETPAFLYSLQQLTVWGMGVPLGIATFAGLAFTTIMAFRKRLPGDLLILSWVLPYFLITGAFQVKFLRYLLMITPLLSLMGARMLIAWWESIRGQPVPEKDLNEFELAWLRSRYRSPSGETERGSEAEILPNLAKTSRWRFFGERWAIATIALVLGASLLYSIAYVNIYSQPHTAVSLSQWINSHVPLGATLANEHWEEGIPDLGRYKILTLPLYDDDTSGKKQLIIDALQQADYVVFYSNRLYGTIPRLKDRYPVTTKYYELLFSGNLGFELEYFASSYPRLGDITLIDDTFKRPGLPSPPPLASFKPSPIPFNLGYADESFTVYDHPKTMVFKKVQKIPPQVMSALLGNVEPFSSPPHLGLAYTQESFQRQTQGGTWSELFESSWLTENVPELVWLFTIELLALVTLPLAFYLFRSLPDRGYLLAKPLGLLMVAYAPWLLASLKWLPFSRWSVVLGVLTVGTISLICYKVRKDEIRGFFRDKWRFILASEVLFLAAFLFLYALRLANPDLWHPYRGGEKPMDFAYLNAVVKSDYMPPYDPWFAGGYLNYYYFGQFLVATLIKFTGIQPSVAYNLAVPLFFAMTFTGVFSLVYNLTAHYQQRRSTTSSRSPSTVLAGIAGGMFVTVLGNLDGLIQVIQGISHVTAAGGSFPTFDYWRSSRMMPPTISITEFPYFTFLFADLHAHLMIMPFSILAIGLAFTFLVRNSEKGKPSFKDQLPLIFVMGLVIGSLRWINTWDLPTYLILTGAVVTVIELRQQQNLSALVLAAVKTGIILGLGAIFFLPLQLSYQTFYLGVVPSPERTPLWQYLAIHGFFLFLILSYMGYLLLRDIKDRLWLWRPVPSAAAAPLSESPASFPSADVKKPGAVVNWSLILYIALVLLATAALFRLGFSTAAFLFAPCLILLPLFLERLLSQEQRDILDLFLLLAIGIAFAIGMGVELVTIEGDIQRMNTVFKFYLQGWILLGIVSAFALWRLGSILFQTRPNLGRVTWVAIFSVLLGATLIYPVMATPVRLRDRFQILTPTRDGMEFMKSARYQDEKGEINLSYDYEAIHWMQQNIKGSPVIVEGITPLYRWGSRVSIYTGLPTVLGWDWHQTQQRWSYRWAVQERQQDINRFFATTSIPDTTRLLKKYGVKYVYVGRVERLYYPPEGIVKFQKMEGVLLEKVHENPEVVIYRVLG